MNDRGVEFADLLGVVSLYIGIKNLAENEQQSDQQIKMLRQNDVKAANDRQAAYLLAELDRKFNEQNEMLKKIMEAVIK